jgi:hypothetical protein
MSKQFAGEWPRSESARTRARARLARAGALREWQRIASAFQKLIDIEFVDTISGKRCQRAIRPFFQRFSRFPHTRCSARIHHDGAVVRR